MLEVLENRYDRATETLTAVVRLRNTSQRTLRGPLHAHVKSASSALGQLDAPPVTPLVFDVATLAAGATTQPATWQFRIRDVQPERVGNRYQLNLLDLRVLITSTP